MMAVNEDESNLVFCKHNPSRPQDDWDMFPWALTDLVLRKLNAGLGHNGQQQLHICGLL